MEVTANLYGQRQYEWQEGSVTTKILIIVQPSNHRRMADLRRTAYVTPNVGHRERVGVFVANVG